MRRQKPFARGHGILMPLFSLNSNYGIGVLGEPVRKFLDFLSRAGCNMWQLLPLGPTGYGDSPYQSFSAFAGNPYFLNPEWFLKKGWITAELLEEFKMPNTGGVDYSALYKSRNELFGEIFSGFQKFATVDQRNDLKNFYIKNKYWLEDYSMFLAIKEHFGGCGRSNFPSYKTKSDEAVLFAKTNLMDRIDFFVFLEYAFDAQWREIKEYARLKNILLVGDIPLYVADDSADVWANPKLFTLDKAGLPTSVAGVPPDIFSKDGQLWGNPLYDWDAHRAEDFFWWRRRIARQAELFDVIRIDHFIGIVKFYSIAYGSKTAENGCFYIGPGSQLTDVFVKVAGDTKFIAEDLGLITNEVRRLIKSTGFPGMRLMQFAFDGTDNPNMLHNIPKNSFVYTGTHDNQTTVGFFNSCSLSERKNARRYMNIKRSKELAAAVIRECHKSRANNVIIPLYDYMGLDDSARINTPSTLGGNWMWRVTSDPDNMLADEIHALAEIYKRNN